MTEGIWLRTDEEREAQAWLGMVQRQLPAVREDLYAWKQIALTLHSAVQAFMVLALRGTDTRHVLNKKSEKEWLDWAHTAEGEPPGDLRLDRFLNLYKKVKSQRMMQWDTSKCFEPADTHDRSIRLLNDIRNEFTHFVPMGWSLEVSGMPMILLDSVSLVRFLAFESGNVRWSSDDLRRSAARSLEELEEAGEDLRAAYKSGSFPTDVGEQLDDELSAAAEEIEKTL